MRKVKKRQKGDVVNRKRKKEKKRAFKSESICLMRIKIINHVKTARKKRKED